MVDIRAAVWALLIASGLSAQSVVEVGGEVVYEGTNGKQTNLGAGFSPILTQGGRVALLRGRAFGYGEAFDCAKKDSKNWVAVYDPTTNKEDVLFDRTIPFDGGKWNFCIFEQMQLSHDGSVLYLVSPVYATSGSLAIVRLSSGAIRFVTGVDSVYVIESGPHRDELVYQRRVLHKSPDDGLEYPAYPLIHATANGRQIAEISDESFTVRGNREVPVLRAYLRKIGGTITVNGRRLP